MDWHTGSFRFIFGTLINFRFLNAKDAETIFGSDGPLTLAYAFLLVAFSLSSSIHGRNFWARPLLFLEVLGPLPYFSTPWWRWRKFAVDAVGLVVVAPCLC